MIFRYFTASGKYTILNVIGLTIGISLFVLIAMLLNYELSFDSIHQNRKKILQVCELDLKSDEYASYSAFPLPLTLKNDFPEVKYVVGINQVMYKESSIKYNDIDYKGFTGASVEPDLFNIFSYKLLVGSTKDLLIDPEKVAVSESLAHKIFNNDNPVGKTITMGTSLFTISHVFRDMPENSTAKFDILFSDKLREKTIQQYKEAWWHGGLVTYVILQDNFPISDFEKHLKAIPEKYYPDFLKGRSTYFASSFYQSHFNTSLIGQAGVSYLFIMLLGGIALIILVIACVNYISLTLARAFKMNIDAGIRRISGAQPHQIISQQITLSMLNVMVAILLAVPLVVFILPFFEQLAERPLHDQLFNSSVWIWSIATISIVALISGLIPGYIFSCVVPLRIIKSKNQVSFGRHSVQTGMMVFQFTLAIVLIVAQFFILKQINFMKNTDLGYKNDNLIAIDLGTIDAPYRSVYDKAKLYKSELEREGARLGLSIGSITENIPGFYYQNSFTVIPQDSELDECLVVSTAVDENFISTFGIKMAYGRFFSKKFGTDATSFVINETAMKKFGWKNLDSKFIKLSFEDKKQPVIGVVKDIHPNTLKDRIPPMIFRFGQYNNFPAYLTYYVPPAHQAEIKVLMKKTWESVIGQVPFCFRDVKKTYYLNYAEEQRLSKIIGIFATLAIFLALLGLLGLASFYAESRMKEIGIRRVNGARTSEVIALVNRNFIAWISISFLIACPIAWYAMHQWLQNFAYKTELSWWVFALAGVLALAVALLTVSLQSWRAATRNPVESLRYE